MAASLSSLLAGADGARPHEARRVPRGRRLRGAREGARDEARGSHRGGHGRDAARPRRRRLPDGPQGEPHPDARAARKPNYLVVNADESEPGAFKDREVMARVPHRLIEGCLIAAHAIESHARLHLHPRRVPGRVRDPRAPRSRRRAPHGACSATSTIVVHRGAGAYICGEETALLESLEGKRGQPRTKPPFPRDRRVSTRRRPQINNVETIATLPTIFALGGEEFAKIGVPVLARHARSSRSRATSQRPGNYELAARHHAADADLRVRRRRPARPQAEGDHSGRLVRADPDADQIDTPIDYDSLAAAGSFFGSAGVMVHRRPLLHGAARAARARSSTCTSRAASARRAGSARAGSSSC